MRKFFEWIKSFFNKTARVFVDLIKEAFPLAKQVIMGQLSAFGAQVIAELAAGNLSGEEKRAEAFNRMKTKAGEIRVVITNSMINALIEILYQKYKTEKEIE